MEKKNRVFIHFNLEKAKSRFPGWTVTKISKEEFRCGSDMSYKRVNIIVKKHPEKMFFRAIRNDRIANTSIQKK